MKFDVAADLIASEMATNVTRVNEQYLAALERVRSKMKADGDLTGLIKVLDEVKAVKEAGSNIYKPGDSTGVEIAKLRETYVKGISKFESAHSEKLSKLTDNYLATLGKVKRDLVAQEDVKNALAVREEEERVQALLTAIRPTAEPSDTTEKPTDSSELPDAPMRWISKDATFTISSSKFMERSASLLSREKDSAPEGDAFSFHSATQTAPYIVIDLGSQKLIGGMNIINRTGLDQQRASTLTAWISTTPCFFEVEPAWQADSVETVWNFELPRPVKGRYVKLGLRETTSLHLAHVKINGWGIKDRTNPSVPEVTASQKEDLENGLVVHFPFDSLPFQKFVSSANEDISAVADGAKWKKSGHSGGSLDFDGKDAMLAVSHFEWGSPLTVSAWVRYRSFNDDSGFFHIGAGWNEDSLVIGNAETGSDLEIGLSDKEKQRDLFSGHGFWEKNSWVHLTVTIDGENEVRVYRNGQIYLKRKSNVPFGRGVRPIRSFGSSNRPGVNGHFDGDLDDIRIYERALTEIEVETLFRLDGGYE